MIKLDVTKTLLSRENQFQLDCRFETNKGDLIAIYGESGAGKSSLLRMISGLLSPDFGTIEVNNEIWFAKKTKIDRKPQERKIGFVFQDAALFPNMSVRENINYAIPRTENKTWLEEIIKMIDLKELASRSPETLSGGQKQRVALARAIAGKPDILLLDEALSALDHSMRAELQDYILTIHKKLGLTTFMVSHDIAEISKMADQLMIMEQGKIVKIGDPISLLSNRKISGKFQFTGEILSIKSADVIFIVNVLIGKNLVKVVADKKTAENLKIGEQVVVVSKAFNPLIYKIEAS